MSYQKLDLFLRNTLTSWYHMRKFRLYEGSDGGFKGPRCVNCGPLGETETDLEGWVGIHHNFGPIRD